MYKNEIGLKQSTGVGLVNGFKKVGGGAFLAGNVSQAKVQKPEGTSTSLSPPMCFTLKAVLTALTVTLHSKKRRGHGSFSLNAVSPQPSLAPMEWESHKGWDEGL